MSDILLTHGYFIAEDAHEQQIMKPYPTLGLLYVSSYLKAIGFEVDLYDTTFSSLEAFSAAIAERRPSLVGLYCNMMTRQNVLRQIAICKGHGATVILGGPEPVNYATEYLAAGADLIVDGEGELTLEELIPHFARYGRRNLQEIAGILFRDDDGRVIRTGARPQIRPLSGQPWPDREAIDLDRYLATWKAHHGMSSVSLITARGCPYTCRWCSHSVFGHTHRRRRPEEVAEEVAWIEERYNPDQLWYADDVFTIHRRWFRQYAAELKQRGLRIPFECISRADRLNEDDIDLLAEMGCHRLWIGSESGSQRVLDAMDRKTEATDVQIKTRMLQARGIEVGMFIMLGYEGEKIEDIEATVEHLKKAGPDLFLTTVAYPIKGTPYYQEVAGRIVTETEWAEGSDRDLKVAGRYSARFYDHATRWMVNEVNRHKARQEGDRDWLRLAKLYLNAQRGRLGMRLTANEREMAGPTPPGGRGWSARDRAVDGW